MRASSTALVRCETLSGGRVVRKAQHTWLLWITLLSGRVAGGICVATWASISVRRQAASLVSGTPCVRLSSFAMGNRKAITDSGVQSAKERLTQFFGSAILAVA
jgi:hypothetical protein